MDDPTSLQAKLLTVLQRQLMKDEEKEEKDVKSPKENQTPKNLEKSELNSLPKLNSAQKEKTNTEKKTEQAEDLSISKDGSIKVGNRTPSIDATKVLYNMQQSRKQLSDPGFPNILKNSPHLVANSAAKTDSQSDD